MKNKILKFIFNNLKIIQESDIDQLKGLKEAVKDIDNNISYEDFVTICVKESEKKIVKEMNNYIFVKQWRKPDFLSGQRVEDHIIVTESDINICLTKESLEESTAYFLPVKNELFKVTESVMFLQPETKMNPTTQPSWVKRLDEGKMVVEKISETEKIVEFSGELLKGKYKLTRESTNSDFWSIVKEAQHKRDVCMKCSAAPTVEILWAEGKAHAWFCDKHFEEWKKDGDSWHEIDALKKVQNVMASKKFSENTNPNIK